MTATDGGSSKAELRRKIKERLLKLSPEEKRRESRKIARQVEALPCYQDARKVMFYVGAGWEVNTTLLIRQALAAGKEVSVPYCLLKEKRLVVSQLRDLAELKPGAYGILEPAPDNLRPVDPCQLDLVVVPGLAFDEAGNRLGRGKGYYDRLLAELKPQTTLIAMAFDFQVLPRVPVEAHDRPVHIIITPTRTILCQRPSPERC